MNKLEFLTKMRNRLEQFGLPQDDINDALSYYEEVFLDAGFGKEEATSEELGDPVEIADGILRDSGIHTGDASEFPPRYDNTQMTGGNAQPTDSGNKSKENFILKFILLVLTFPIWLPLIVTVFALLFALLVSVLAIVISLAFAGIALIIGGIQIALEAPPIGIICIGIGFMVTGIFAMIGKPFFRWIIPASGRLVRGLVNKIKGLFGRKEGQKYV